MYILGNCLGRCPDGYSPVYAQKKGARVFSLGEEEALSGIHGNLRALIIFIPKIDDMFVG